MMGEVLNFPGETTRLGYRRVRKRCRPDDPNQLDLFLPPPSPIASFAPALSAFEQALLLDERGDPKAAELYLKAIENRECVPDAFCNLGILESRSGNTAKAFDCFTSCLTQDPRHLEAHYNLANLYFEVNDFRLAQVHYEIAAEVDPSFANALFNLGLVQSINQELDAAVTTLTRYQQLVSREEASNADEILRNLRQSLAARSKGRPEN
jgi:tetratricopeptide (TPR) repeat protein